MDEPSTLILQGSIPKIIVNTYRRTNTLPKFLAVAIFFSIDISLEAREIICRDTAAPEQSLRGGQKLSYFFLAQTGILDIHGPLC